MYIAHGDNKKLIKSWTFGTAGLVSGIHTCEFLYPSALSQIKCNWHDEFSYLDSLNLILNESVTAVRDGRSALLEAYTYVSHCFSSQTETGADEPEAQAASPAAHI